MATLETHVGNAGVVQEFPEGMLSAELTGPNAIETQQHYRGMAKNWMMKAGTDCFEVHASVQGAKPGLYRADDAVDRLRTSIRQCKLQHTKMKKSPTHDITPIFVQAVPTQLAYPLR